MYFDFFFISLINPSLNSTKYLTDARISLLLSFFLLFSSQVLGDAKVTWSVIRAELQELASKHVVPRRTRIDDSFGDEADSEISEEDLLANDRSVRIVCAYVFTALRRIVQTYSCAVSFTHTPECICAEQTFGNLVVALISMMYVCTGGGGHAQWVHQADAVGPRGLQRAHLARHQGQSRRLQDHQDSHGYCECGWCGVGRVGEKRRGSGQGRRGVGQRGK